MKNLVKNRFSNNPIAYGGLIISIGLCLIQLVELIVFACFQMSENNDLIRQAMQVSNIFKYLVFIVGSACVFSTSIFIRQSLEDEDYKSILLIRKRSLVLNMMMSFLLMACFIFLSNKNILTILISFPIFFVLILYSYRSILLGLNLSENVSKSFIIESISRLLFILGSSFLFVYVLNKENDWIIYLGIFSICIGAIVSLFYVIQIDAKQLQKIRKLSLYSIRHSEVDWIKTLVIFGLFLMLFTSNQVIDTLFLESALNMSGITPTLSEYISKVVVNHSNYMLVFTYLIALSFMFNLIPKIWDSNEDSTRYFKTAVEGSLFLIIPIGLTIFFFSKEILFILMGNQIVTLKDTINHLYLTFSLLDYDSYIVQIRMIESIIGAISLMFMMYTLSLKKTMSILKIMGVGLVVKVVSLFAFCYLFKEGGCTLSNILFYMILLVLSIYEINHTYSIKWKPVLQKVGVMLLAGLIMSICCYGINVLINGALKNRMLMFVFVLAEIMIVNIVYLYICWLFKLPQRIFLKRLNKDEIR